MELLNNLEYWHWGILGAILIVLEMFAAGAFLLFTGVAAFLVMIIIFIFPIDWTAQITIWGILSILMIVAWQTWRKHNPAKHEESNLNKRGHQYVGRSFTIDEPVTNGFGKIKVDDSTWKIECDEDYPEGTKVKITDVDGVVLKATIDK